MATQVLGVVAGKLFNIMLTIIKEGSVEKERARWKIRRLAEQIVEDLELPKIYTGILVDELFSLYERMVAVFGEKAKYEEAVEFVLKAGCLFVPDVADPIYFLAYNQKIPLPDTWDLFGINFSRILLDKILEKRVVLKEEEDSSSLWYHEVLLSAFLSAAGIPRVFDINGMPLHLDEPNIFLTVAMYKMLRILRKNRKNVSLDEAEFWLKMSCEQFNLFQMLTEAIPDLEKEPKGFEEYINPLRYKASLLVLKNLFEEVFSVAEEFGILERLKEHCGRYEEELNKVLQKLGLQES